jgi:acetyltransferase-like isoleucine patch superfamily enzyme
MMFLLKLLNNICNRLLLLNAQIGSKVRLHGLVRIEKPENIIIKSRVWIHGLTVVGPGKVIISEDCIIRNLFIETVNESALVFIDSHVFIGNNSHFIANNKIDIGKNTLIAPRVMLIDNDHKIQSGAIYKHADIVGKPIKIGENVWLGANVTVLKGVSIFNNAVIGANSLVTKNVGENKICVGSPIVELREIGS